MAKPTNPNDVSSLSLAGAEGTKADEQPKVHAAKEKKAEPTSDDLAEALAAAECKNPGFIQSILNKVRSNPVSRGLYDTNSKGLKIAAKIRGGQVINDKIIKSIIFPLFKNNPGALATLDNEIVQGMLKVAIAQVIALAVMLTSDRLPEKMRKYADALNECTVTAAYMDTFGGLNLEDILDKLMSGEIMSVLKSVVDE